MYQIKYQCGMELQVIGMSDNGLCRIVNERGVVEYEGPYTTCERWLSDRKITMASKPCAHCEYCGKPATQWAVYRNCGVHSDQVALCDECTAPLQSPRDPHGSLHGVRPIGSDVFPETR